MVFQNVGDLCVTLSPVRFSFVNSNIADNKCKNRSLDINRRYAEDAFIIYHRID